MAVRERRGKWHYRFEIDGHEWTGNTGLVATERNRKSAERVELESRQAIEQGKAHVLTLQAIPFNSAADKFVLWCQAVHRDKPNTWKRVNGSFTSLRAHFGRSSVSAITAGDIADYIAWRATVHGVKDVTIRHDLHSLSKFMGFAIKHNWRRDNPVRAEDIPSDEAAIRIHVFSEIEELAYMTASVRFPKLHQITKLMLYQGCRPEELLNVEVADVDLERKYLRITGGKTSHARRTLKIRPEAGEILAALVSHAEGLFLFSAERNSRLRLSLSTVENWHVKVRESVKIPCVIYDWRHTFATRAANGGMSLATLSKVLGHGSLRSVMKYVHPDQSEQDRAMDQLSLKVIDPDQSRTKQMVLRRLN